MTSILAFLQSLLPSLEPVLMSVEASGQAELQALIAGVQSPWLKDILMGLDVSLDAYAKAEIAKLGPQA